MIPDSAVSSALGVMCEKSGVAADQISHSVSTSGEPHSPLDPSAKMMTRVFVLQVSPSIHPARKSSLLTALSPILSAFGIEVQADRWRIFSWVWRLKTAEEIPRQSSAWSEVRLLPRPAPSVSVPCQPSSIWKSQAGPSGARTAAQPAE